MKKKILLIIMPFACLFLLFINSCGTVSALQSVSNDSFDNYVESGVSGGIIPGNNINSAKPAQPAETADSTAAAESYAGIYDINPKFEPYLQINPEVAGFIKIDGTIIDFPVLFSGENDFYLKHDINKTESDHGAVFMDMNNHGAILDRNTIIHAHNFNDGTLFSELENYREKNFFETHRLIEFDNLYSDMQWEVFAVYVVSAENYYLLTSFNSEQQYVDFVNLIKSRAVIWADYTPRPGDYMLTLHTCSNEFKGAHLIIHAKLVKKTDNFKK